MASDPRHLLERLFVERGEDFSALSRMLGRNSSYVQQYMRHFFAQDPTSLRTGDYDTLKLLRLLDALIAETAHVSESA